VDDKVNAHIALRRSGVRISSSPPKPYRTGLAPDEGGEQRGRDSGGHLEPSKADGEQSARPYSSAFKRGVIGDAGDDMAPQDLTLDAATEASARAIIKTRLTEVWNRSRRR